MQHSPALLIALLAAAPPAAAQVPAPTSGWHLGGGVDVLRFGHVVVSSAAPGVAAEVRPTARPALHLSLTRTTGPWHVSLEGGWGEGHIEAGNDVLAIRDLTAEVTRYRLSLGVGRRLLGVGTGTVVVELAPTVDLWSVSGDTRTRGGLEGRLVLRAPLGAVELEHRLGFGVSGSPIESADVGEISESRGLRTFLIGLGLRGRV